VETTEEFRLVVLAFYMGAKHIPAKKVFDNSVLVSTSKGQKESKG